MSDFKTKIFPEPELEFGDKHHHPDPRLGLLQAGPLQPNLGDTIKVGVVGSALTVEKSGEFLNAIEDGFEGKTEKHPNLHPDFPGLRNQNPYRCRFEMVADEDGVLTKGQIEKIAKEPSDARAVEMAVEAVMAQLEKLEAHHERPDVVMVSLPVKLIERVWRNERAGTNEVIGDNATEAKAGKETSPNFRGLLKARAMDLRFPIQIVWEDVINPDAKIPRKIKENSDRQTQDRADLAWNLMTTLYYKGSGKVPWRRLPEEGEFTACYIGISFFKDAKTDEIWTSAAQMFDERGRGFILRGGPAQSESRGRHPFLTIDEAHKLTESALAAYKSVHRTMPARVIVMKTSRFREDEAEGVGRALDEAGVELRDLIWVHESYSVKVLRDGDFPVLRGTFVELDGNGLLYTNGSIPYYGTYPGLYVPNPLLICPHPQSESTIEQIAKEVFSLTKVNWNSTQMNQRLPIPIRAARKVGDVLKYLPEGQKVSSDYRKYI
ncbi:argonaute/piwi family protein [Celeribacter sp. SCSIO 80788]|uniref:argonaute/piwi family protein n=1 Tax=Celeribacter sp. SCSIO 80788 TaxID=3117013 RepID=UPI003DA5016A